MIGNWVLYTTPKIPKPVKIGKIYVNEKGTVCEVNFYGNLGNDSISEICFDYIPLTPEILEKNGFRHGDGFEKRWYYVKVEDKKVTLYQSNTFYMLKIDEGIWPKLNNIYIRFVHELQHALRLCGIDKEITL